MFKKNLWPVGAYGDKIRLYLISDDVASNLPKMSSNICLEKLSHVLNQSFSSFLFNFQRIGCVLSIVNVFHIYLF